MARFPKCDFARIEVYYSNNKGHVPYVRKFDLQLALSRFKIPFEKHFGKTPEIIMEGAKCFLIWDVENLLEKLLKTEEEEKKKRLTSFLSKR